MENIYDKTKILYLFSKEHMEESKVNRENDTVYLMCQEYVSNTKILDDMQNRLENFCDTGETEEHILNLRNEQYDLILDVSDLGNKIVKIVCDGSKTGNELLEFSNKYISSYELEKTLTKDLKNKNTTTQTKRKI